MRISDTLSVMEQETVISVQHVHKSYGDLKAVDDLDFAVKKASCCGFLGPNGAGKTTMMKMLYAKALPDRNKDTVINVFGYDPRRQELHIKSLAGVAPQDDDLDEELSVIQNLRIFARLYGIPRTKADERIDYLLEFMELSSKKPARIRELSGGMRRRLIIARALMNEPELLILDEPTTGLDPQVRQLIWDKLRGLKNSGVTILLTTHYMEEAFQIADEVIIMDHGRKVMEGNPRQLLENEIEGHVLEVLNKNSVPQLDERMRGVVRTEEGAERVLYYSHEHTLLQQMAEGLPHGEYYLRRTNLEDLFLRATGRNLNAGQ
jgi:lipooligosaccharide transport system ATP-binding protein